MRLAFLLIVSFSFAVICNAQSIEVYYVKGDAKLISGEKSTSLKEKSKIVQGSSIHLAEDAMLVLCQDEKAIVLKEAKLYSANDITSLFEETKRSLSDRYISYIWNQAHLESESGNNMGVTGMVSRGERGILNLPDSAISISETILLEFDKDLVPGYLFIYQGKKAIFNIDLDSATYPLRIGGVLEEGEWYGLAASMNEEAPFSGITYFKWASITEKQSVNKALADLLIEIEGYPEELKNKLIAAFYESNRYVYQLKQ